MADNVFSRLHELLAQEFVDRLQAGKCTNCGRTPATAQELEAMRKFLADNGIVGGMNSLAPIRSLTDDMPFEVKDPEDRIDRPASRKTA